jgi:hypothetical protein
MEAQAGAPPPEPQENSMSTDTSGPTRRDLLAGSAAGAAIGGALLAAPAFARTMLAGSEEIRPFRIAVPDADLVDLRNRIAITRWPERETVKDQSQGVQLATLQQLVRYWGSDYDWRKAEAKLNALPQFITTIDGLDIQFITCPLEATPRRCR